MVNANTATKNAWNNNEPKTVRILLNGTAIPSENIYKESMQIDESICDDESMHYMGNIPARLNLKATGINTDIIGQSIKVYCKAGNTTELQLFSGFVTSANLDATKTKVNLIAYDRLYDINNLSVGEWYNGLTFPLTLKQFRDSFFTYIGITQENTTLCNDVMTVRKTMGGDIKGSDILNAICEINGVFGALSRDGAKYLYKKLAQNFQYTISPSSTMKLEYEDFTCKPINKVWVRADSDDIGATAGTGTNTYIVEGNILAYGQSASELGEIAQRLYTQIYGGAYVPTKAEVVGNAIYETGDCVRYTKPDGSYVTSYILARKISGLYSLHDNLSAKGCENYGNALPNNSRELYQLRGQATRITKDIEGITTEVETIREDYASKSELSQTSESLTAQISRLQSEIDGSVYIYYTDTTPTLLNYPAWDFTYNIPCDNTVKLSNTLKFEYKDEYYQKNLRSLAFDETANKSYRFMMQDGEYGWIEATEGDIGAILEKVTRLEMTTDGITAQVTQIETDYATKTELNSQIKQTSDSITLSVSENYASKKATEDAQTSLQNQITQSVGEIEDIKTNYATTRSVNSKIDQSASNITSSVAATYETKASATGTKNNLQGQINTANSNITNIQANYATKTAMNSAISQSANLIIATVSESYETKEDAQATKDDVAVVKLNYATKTDMNSAISQSASSITQSVSATYETKTSATNTKNNLQGQINTTNTNVTNLSNNVSNNYATKTAMNSAISQSASSIEASVSAVYQTKTDARTETTRVNGQLALKVAKNDNDQIVSMINASANQITLNSNRLVVKSDNFELSADGTLKCISAELKNAKFLSSQNEYSMTLTASGLKVTGKYGTTTITEQDINCSGVRTKSIYAPVGESEIIVGSKVSTNAGFSVGGNFTVGVGHTSDLYGAVVCHTTMTVNGDTNLKDDVVLGGSSYKVGFFGSSGATKKRVSAATSSTILTQLNALIDALVGYGLISKY